MTEYVTTPISNFSKLEDFSFNPNYHNWRDMKMHYLDEGPKDGPVMLLIHGMPTWSYLYRDVIPILVDAGYRCIAPDHLGFGKSDKPVDSHWYSIARHIEILSSLIIRLDLKNITLICQDWGGPTGLAQAMTMPDRFSRLTIMNTWLHHPNYQYTESIRRWNRNWQTGGLFDRPKPNIGILMLLASGFMSRDSAIQAITSGEVSTQFTALAKCSYEAYIAPFHGLNDDSYNGLRSFPLSIPFHDYSRGNGAAQELHYQLLLGWTKPIHFIWGIQDDIFTESWGRKWSARFPQSSFTGIQEAAHFLQNTHGKEVAKILVDRIAEEQ